MVGPLFICALGGTMILGVSVGFLDIGQSS